MSATARPRPWEALPASALSAWSPDLRALADEIIEAIRAEVPAYARPLEGPFGQAVRRGVEQALSQFDEMVRNPARGRPAGRNVYVALGRGEVREGRSLESLLAAYRVGARVAWRRLAAAGVSEGMATETLVVIAESIFAYIDELSAESAEGFAQEQAARAGEADRRRTELLGLLVREPAPPDDVLSGAAESAGWHVPNDLAIVVWPAEKHRPLARLPLGSIAAVVEGLWCAAIADPAAPGRHAEIARAMEGTVSGIGSVVVPAEAARSHRRARAAFELAQERSFDHLLVADEHRLDLLLRTDPSLTAEIDASRLAPLEGESDLSRQRLRATLLAWLRHEGNATAAAHELDVHPQTVRYRLARLRDLFGEQLDEPDVRFELEVALRATGD